MSDDPPDNGDREAAAARRRRLAEVFGDVLPETTGDERESEAPADTDRESWYRRNRPPHHE